MKKVLEDEQLEFNVTTSLCQSTADTEFRQIFIETDKTKPVSSIVLTTDGIINCFRSVEAYQSLIKNIYHAYLETENEKDIEKARLELADGLNQLSEKGSGDDLSVAIAIRWFLGVKYEKHWYTAIKKHNEKDWRFGKRI